MLWSVAIFSAAFLLLALSFLFGQAKVEVYPKTEAITLNENFSAVKVSENDSLVFDLVVISGKESETVEANAERELSEKAAGTVVIFNSYSSASQRLDIDTRLSGSNGKLYKTQKQITVPGMKADGTPGSVEVPIYAAEAGEEYNAGPLDFQIVGFQGTPKYEKFKVRTKTETAITGGFIGTSLVATEADKQAAVNKLQTTLKEKLFKKAIGQIPDGFILFKDAAAFVVDKIDLPLGQTELLVTVEGTLYGLLFNEQELTKKIAEKKLAGYDGSEIYIHNIRDLDFTLAPVGDVSLQEMTSISFNLSGSVPVVWKLDVEKFTAELRGRNRKDFVSILSQYQNIDHAELTLFPLWLRTIPDQPDKIEVRVNYPAELN